MSELYPQQRIRLLRTIGRLGVNDVQAGREGTITRIVGNAEFRVVHVLFDGGDAWQFQGSAAEEMLRVVDEEVEPAVARDTYTGEPHEWRWAGWVDWVCDRCECSFHGSDTAGCGRSQDELRSNPPHARMMLYQIGFGPESEWYVERTCDEWRRLRGLTSKASGR